MSKVLIIGAGGVGKVVAHKCAQKSDLFQHIYLASRTLSKCQDIAKAVKNKYGTEIFTFSLDADDVREVKDLLNRLKPDLVINVALPYQDLSIMQACLDTNTHYLDTANYEPKDEARFEYKWQWAYHERFQNAGLTAILGCGFDPGVTGVFCAYAAKHHFDEIKYLDIVDCNAGDHGHPFATNFNPEINIREVTQKGKYFHNGHWIETAPHEISRDLDYPNIGTRRSYLIYHEELESLVKNFPSIIRARFWMTFSDSYLTHLRVIHNIGMDSIAPVNFQGQEIVPLEFLKQVLPNPGSLAENYKGETSIGCRISGIKDGKNKTYYIYNNCSHQAAFQDTNSQAVSFTTGVPAMVGASMLLQGYWNKKGTINVEAFDPDPFLKEMSNYGLPWNEMINIDLQMD